MLSWWYIRYLIRPAQSYPKLSLSHVGREMDSDENLQPPLVDSMLLWFWWAQYSCHIFLSHGCRQTELPPKHTLTITSGTANQPLSHVDYATILRPSHLFRGLPPGARPGKERPVRSYHASTVVSDHVHSRSITICLNGQLSGTSLACIPRLFSIFIQLGDARRMVFLGGLFHGFQAANGLTLSPAKKHMISYGERWLGFLSTATILLEEMSHGVPIKSPKSIDSSTLNNMTFPFFWASLTGLAQVELFSSGRKIYNEAAAIPSGLVTSQNGIHSMEFIWTHNGVSEQDL